MTSSKQTFDVTRLVRDNIRRMKPYSSARDEFKGEAEIFLDANENPYPSPYNRYPDPLQWNIKNKLSGIKGINPEQIFLGNGSDEPIDLLIRAFCEPNRDAILITEPTYGMYAVCADVNAVAVKTALLTPDFDLDVNALNSSLDASVKLIFLCSPNNPTAALLNTAKIEKIIRNFDGIVVIDEAYIDFTAFQGWVSRLHEFPNLVVLQTFSKAWGLAGLRCGMAYASTEIISVLNKIKYPYNINVQTQELVLQALDNESYKDKCVAEILEQRTALAQSLSKLTNVQKVFPSDANFLLIRINEAKKVYEYLMKKKIIVR
ncbi:MAG TPA: histidinol-phosphate transaminase, partial [Ohtaekwangia sp.]|nr:histidinol-phosphate transaminase [Ohtaekwangia sp.]